MFSHSVCVLLVQACGLQILWFSGCIYIHVYAYSCMYVYAYTMYARYEHARKGSFGSWSRFKGLTGGRSLKVADTQSIRAKPLRA